VPHASVRARALGQSESTVAFVDTEFADIVRQVRPGATKVKLWATLYETPGADRGDLVSIQQLIDEGANEWPQEANFGTMFYTGGTTGTAWVSAAGGGDAGGTVLTRWRCVPRCRYEPGRPKAALRTKRNPAGAEWLKSLDMDKYGKVRRRGGRTRSRALHLTDSASCLGAVRVAGGSATS